MEAGLTLAGCRVQGQYRQGMASLRIPAGTGPGGTAVINVTGLGDEPGGIGDVTGIAYAIKSARDYGAVTYLTEDGRSVAAIIGVGEPGA